ncbi:hypothetical protein GF362_03000 [Candidatus Dojkabacteria bacterium]|nr:hypothetical protein [Candidatus Dojkabacteria bacterium]
MKKFLNKYKLRPIWKACLIFILIFLVYTIFMSYLENSNVNTITSKPETDEQNIVNETPSNEPEDVVDKNIDLNHELTYVGWIPDWASESGYESLQLNSQLINQVSPVWYKVNEDGTIQSTYEEKNQKLLFDLVNENNIELIPSIIMFDHELFSEVLNDERKLEIHIKNIVDEVVEQNYHGIDLDYESTQLDDKDKYFEFLELLSFALHAQDKILSVSVVPKWGDNISYSYLPETRQVQDWNMIKDYADYIRIMAYDYTYTNAKYPGPIAPLEWVEQIVEYGLGKIPKEKIILGIHLYSYEWSYKKDNRKSQEIIFDADLNEGIEDSITKSYTYAEVLNILDEYKGKTESYQGEKFFTYTTQNEDTDSTETRILVYIDQNGIKQRINIAKQYKLKGVAFWRLGDEKNLLQEI